MRDDGVIYICDLVNQAENGDMPKEILEIRGKYWFEMRNPGYSRVYAAQGVNERIDMLVRIPRSYSIQADQYAVLGNGDQYRISMVAHRKDEFQRTKMIDSKYYRSPVIQSLEYTELTLVRLDSNYDVEAFKNQGCSCID